MINQEFPHGQRKFHRCRFDSTCGMPATCLPRIYVPAFQLNAFREIDPVSMLLVGFYLCEHHFKRLTAKDLLEGERGRPLREGIEQEFKRRGAAPNFDKAVIGRCSPQDHDFGRSEDIEERRRAN